LNRANLTSLRRKVAKEAAYLLYTLQEREYKQAKTRAAQTWRVHILPSNLEVAGELDKIAEEKEGASRPERLFQMRKDALKIMRTLRDFRPKLVGSVWRGTIHRNSDIDITVFSRTAEDVCTKLQKKSFKIAKTEWRTVTKEGEKETSFHIYILLPLAKEAEVVVRNLEKLNIRERCEIYGDTKTGLTYLQLQKLLKEKPLEKFVPK